jgi:hypothetical protein
MSKAQRTDGFTKVSTYIRFEYRWLSVTIGYLNFIYVGASLTSYLINYPLIMKYSR